MSAEPQGGPQETPLRGPAGNFAGQNFNPGGSPPDPPIWPSSPAGAPPVKPEAQQYRYVRMQPHRGGTILALGITGVAMAIFGGAIAGTCSFCVPLWIIPLASLGLSIPAWVMGQGDLAAMRANHMDPAGRDTTMGGMIAGIVGTVLIALMIMLIITVIVIYVIGFGLAASSSIPNQP